ncbi:hypothetical protein VTN00DRAFT_1276 [Thermoascus crustaceus]|uniref:uncharacterized protein n=1 Tax=Thermoascus crustaceus TaxID=5088 RepID=UPI003742551F
MELKRAQAQRIARRAKRLEKSESVAVVAKKTDRAGGDRRSSSRTQRCSDASLMDLAVRSRLPCAGPLLATSPARARRALSDHVTNLLPGFRDPSA